jgi:hypothetical protein
MDRGLATGRIRESKLGNVSTGDPVGSLGDSRQILEMGLEPASRYTDQADHSQLHEFREILLFVPTQDLSGSELMPPSFIICKPSESNLRRSECSVHLA